MNLESYIGQKNGPYLSWDSVNLPMIRQWCEVMGEKNPAYQEEQAAREAGYEAITAPPLMMQVWGMAGYLGARPEGSATGPSFTMIAELEQAGYTGVVAVNCEQEYLLPLYLGDRIHYETECQSVAGPKQTALGEAMFVTELSKYYNQRKEQVGTLLFRLMFYRPGGSA